MKITAKYLDDIETMVKGQLLVLHNEPTGTPDWKPTISISISEIFRLARLGLWVDKYRQVIIDGMESVDRLYYVSPKYKEALKALPAEKDEK